MHKSSLQQLFPVDRSFFRVSNHGKAGRSYFIVPAYITGVDEYLLSELGEEQFLRFLVSRNLSFSKSEKHISRVSVLRLLWIVSFMITRILLVFLYNRRTEEQKRT